jgi:hypothetical protein
VHARLLPRDTFSAVLPQFVTNLLTLRPLPNGGQVFHLDADVAVASYVVTFTAETKGKTEMLSCGRSLL